MTEHYYQATSKRSNLQITTSKEGLIITLANRSLNNAEWNAIILNKEQTEGLKEFLKHT